MMGVFEGSDRFIVMLPLKIYIVITSNLRLLVLIIFTMSRYTQKILIM